MGKENTTVSSYSNWALAPETTTKTTQKKSPLFPDIDHRGPRDFWLDNSVNNLESNFGDWYVRVSGFNPPHGRIGLARGKALGDTPLRLKISKET